MATQANLDLAQKLYVAYYGRPADSAGQTYWADQIESNGAASVVTAFGTSDEFNARFGDMSSDELVSNLYQQMFGRDAEQAGVDYYTDQLESGDQSLGQIALAIAEGAQGDDETALNNKLDVAQSFTDTAGDDYAGNDAAEYAEDFLSDVGADTDPSSVDVSGAVEDLPESSGGEDGGNTGDSIEQAFTDIPDDNVDANGNVDQTQTIAHVGKTEWDEQGQQATNSDDYTFTLSDQLGEQDVYQGLFLSPVLSAEARNQNSQLFVELLDVRQAGTAEPLGDLPVDGFRFSVDGEQVVISSDEIFQAKTYEELVTAVNNAIDASDNPLVEGFDASLGGDFQATGDNGQPLPDAVGKRIVLTDSNGGTLEEGNFTYSEDASSGGFTLYGEQSTEAPETVQELISTNLDVDNIGYGSQGGTINLAGESNSNVGVEQLDLNAKNGVWFTQLQSRDTDNNTNYQDHLQQINLSGSGYFNVGQQSLDGDTVVGLEEMLAAGGPTEGNADTQSYNGYAGLNDVQNFNGTNFDGDIKFNAYLSDDVIDRDLNDTDTGAADADNALYNYTTSDGDDQVSIATDLSVLEREDAAQAINTGAGNDIIETALIENGDLVNHQLNANMDISAGAGDDVVRTWGAGDVSVNAGGGDDVIYADNSGDASADVADFQRDTWEFNSNAGDGAAPSGVSNSDNDLSNGANGVDQTFDFFKAQVQVSFKGFESQWVTIDSTDQQTSALQINQAIKDAVNNDDVLNNLIEASDGNGNIVNIDSLIDGDNLGQLGIDFRAPAASADAAANGQPVLADGESVTDADLADADGIYGLTADDADDGISNDQVANAGGADSAAESDNSIMAGAGDDVVVLGTGTNSNDTVVFNNSNGNDSIVNFDSADDAGADILDFTHYGVNGGTVSDGVGAADDTVNLVDFASAEDEGFGGLSASAVQAAINGADGDTYGNIGSIGSINDKANSVLMVQNGDDSGIYKAFALHTDDGSDDFSVKLIGSMDFGETQTFTDANIA